MIAPNVLLVYPKNPTTFWSFDEALKMVDRKSAFPPLGLLTIAGMMPAHYALRLVDMNLAPLREADLAWADIVLTSSMIIHWAALEGIIHRCKQAGAPMLNGGPLPTQYADDIEGKAVFYRLKIGGVFPRHLSGSFDFVILPLPLLLNSIHLILHEPLRKAVFKLKQTPTWAHGLITSMKVNQ